MTAEDPDKALCGKDVTDFPWNPPWPRCEACLAVARGSRRLQRVEKPAGGIGDLGDGATECRLVCHRWMRESAELANKLKGRRADFLGINRY